MLCSVKFNRTSILELNYSKKLKFVWNFLLRKLLNYTNNPLNLRIHQNSIEGMLFMMVIKLKKWSGKRIIFRGIMMILKITKIMMRELYINLYHLNNL